MTLLRDPSLYLGEWLRDDGEPNEKEQAKITGRLGLQRIAWERNSLVDPTSQKKDPTPINGSLVCWFVLPEPAHDESGSTGESLGRFETSR